MAMTLPSFFPPSTYTALVSRIFDDNYAIASSVLSFEYVFLAPPSELYADLVQYPSYICNLLDKFLGMFECQRDRLKGLFGNLHCPQKIRTL